MKYFILLLLLISSLSVNAQEFAVMTIFSETQLVDQKKGTFIPEFKGYLEHSSETPPVLGKAERFGAKYEMNVATFIKKMSEKGYSLISTSMGGFQAGKSVTKLFFKKD